MPLILPGNVGSATAATGFDVANSCRFDDGDSAYMHKTPGGAGNRRKFTISAWVKRGQVTTNSFIFSAWTADNDAGHFAFGFESAERLTVDTYSTNLLTTNRVFRDLSAWYHVVCAIDTENDTANNRVRLYVNGVEETSFATRNNPTENADLQANNAVIQAVGTNYYNSQGNVFYDGYMAEFCMIDNQQLTPTSFGEFDSDSEIWKPINVSGLTFGTNGFYLDFEASGNLGNDANGGTDLTEVNLAATDQSIDTCTNNFCVMNSLDNFYGAATFAEGNLQVTTRNAGYSYNTATFGVASGKWYWEIKYSAQTTADSSTNQFMPGIAKSLASSTTDHMGYRNTSYAYQSGGNLFYNNGTTSSGYDAYGIGDIVGIALDIDNLRLYVSKNGTFQNSADPAGGSDGYTITAPDAAVTDLGFYFPAFGDGNDNDIKVGQFNFGSPIHAISSGNTDGNGFGNFEYAVPSGFFSLCTKNLAENGG